MKAERDLLPCPLHCQDRIVFQDMLDGCSIFTFGTYMGSRPQNTTLHLKTNGTLLVELIGSALYFNSTDLFYDFLQRFINTTCPDGGRPKLSYSEICRLETDQPICTLYSLSGAPPNNLFPPGNYTLTYDAFDPRFKYSFWSVQHLAGKGPVAAQVSMEAVFVDNPEVIAPAMLFNAFFFSACVLVLLYYVSGVRVRCYLSFDICKACAA